LLARVFAMSGRFFMLLQSITAALSHVSTSESLK
jgi:hypothetical protein